MIQKPFRGVQLNRTHPLAKGLVGCWLFNEMTGEMVFDLSGNGNSGTLKNGVAWGNGGLEFYGVDDYVSIPNFTLTFPATIIMRVKPSSGTLATSNTLLSRDGGTSFLWFHQGGNKMNMYDGSDNIGTVGLLQEDEWQQIAITFDENGSGYHWYNEQRDLSYSTISEPTNPFELRIGEWSTYDWNGSIYSVRIYNRALSAEEIAWSYREPYAIFDKPLSPALLYAAAAAGAENPYWYYEMLRRRNR